MEQQPSLSFTNISESLEAKTTHQVLPRPPPEIPSNIWKDTHTFISNVESDCISEFDQTYMRQIEELKDEVKEMLVVAANDPVEKINLINSLCRLGVSYHFRAEIEMQLNHIFESQRNRGGDNDYDLYTISVLFRVLSGFWLHAHDPYNYTIKEPRWDISALDDLPDYIKIIYSFLLNCIDEIHNDLTAEEKSYRASYTKETVKEMFAAQFIEAQWFDQNYVPSFDEYFRTATVTAGVFAYTASFFLGMGEEIAEKNNAFEWLLSRPRILSATYDIARLKNDLTSHKVCTEYGLSMNETTGKLDIIFENAWKDIKEECMKPTAVPMEILLRVAKIGCLTELTYKDMDGYTNPQQLKDVITKLFIDQTPI
ncbi:hypothetical protein Dsin_023370 [Dipteronia sinensis]|uniref:Uncharacterized protein n=1 Tax=Dipteronia sinensis TaxID=43782 RepID=A0AAE0A3T1_9ROSI|nr:hypothetical protein Dsin_023370 [Dipteronia sinensis]